MWYLPIEEHKAFRAVSKLNFNWDHDEQVRKLQLQELAEIKLETYDNVVIYKMTQEDT